MYPIYRGAINNKGGKIMNFIILAGGSGTRLFPLSRKNYPKQFMKIAGNPYSLFQQTIQRAVNYDKDIKIFIVTNNKYRFFVQSQLDELFKGQKRPDIEVIYEPKGKNTAPAIALSVKKALDKGIKEEEVFFVSPSDHIIKPQDEFNRSLKKAEECAKQGYIVTFGIKPLKAETGYGYIEVDNSSPVGDCYKVNAFREKPDRETAEQYVSSEKHFWNSGMFMFTASTIKQEMIMHCPNVAKIFYLDTEQEIKDYFTYEVEDISIDYAVMEETKKAAVLPATFGWSDVGSWESIYDALEKNGGENAKAGNVLAVDSKRNLILGNGRLIATIGLEDMIVVDTPDAVLIAKKGECQKVKDIVSTLKENGDSVIVNHLTEYRPWGSFTLLEVGERYKIKRITVNPGETLSLQMHHHRSEHWIVVKGTAKVTNGETVQFVHENESVYIPKSTVHRLENPGKVPLELIEVQVGEYVEEDDIVRFEDKYCRV